MTVQLETRARVTVDAQGAVGPLREAERAAGAVGQEMKAAGTAAQAGGQQVAAAAQRQAVAIRSAADAARQSRAAYQQLGFQLSDVVAQASSGTSAFVILAQQGGQTAAALSGMGGAIGRVAGFLAGPFGAAVFGAVTVIGLLATKSDEASEAQAKIGPEMDANAIAALDLAEATKELNRLTGATVLTVEEQIGALRAAAEAKRQDEIATRRLILAEIELTKAKAQQALARAFDPTTATEFGNPAVTAAADAERRLAALQQQESAQRGAIARAEQAIAAADRKLEEIRADGAKRRAGEEGRLGRARLSAIESARQAPARLDREAERALEAQRRAVEALANARGRFFSSQPSVIEVLEAQDRERAAMRNDDFSRSVAAAADRWFEERQAAREAGRAQAQAVRDELLANAGLLGQALGGSIGNAIGGAAEGLRSGDFRQLGRAGAALTLIARSDSFREGAKKITDRLDKIFGGESGDGTFTRGLGKVLQTAGFGVALADVVGKGSKEERIGGAIGAGAGQAIGNAIAPGIGGEIGKIAGALIGTAIGGLFVKPRFGSVTLGGQGGSVQVGAATGSGGAQRGNAASLGGAVSDTLSQIAERLGGTIGDFAVSIGQNGKFFRVDPTGQGRTSKRDPGVLRFGEDADAAVKAALADAIKDGAIAGVSPRVQAVLQRYAGDVNRAIAEALKVQELEQLLADRLNPFASAFRQFERQAEERLKIARAYGFDVVEIEKLNAEERKKLLETTLQDAARSARQLLDELRFGGRAEGSISQRLAGLGAERARLQGLIDGGDTGQIDALASVIQQQLDLSREAFGSTGPFASERSGAIAALEAVVRQTEARVNDAAAQAQRQTVEKLAEANTSLDELVTLQQRQLAALQAFTGGGGGSGFDAGFFARAVV